MNKYYYISFPKNKAIESGREISRQIMDESIILRRLIPIRQFYHFGWNVDYKVFEWRIECTEERMTWVLLKTNAILIRSEIIEIVE